MRFHPFAAPREGPQPLDRVVRRGAARKAGYAATVRAMAAAGSEDVAFARRWWQGLAASAPGHLAGLWFGIFTGVRNGQAQRTLYVAGTATFDASDETAEWAAGEYVWQPDGRDIVLPGLASLPDQPYEVPLAHAVDVLRQVEPWRDWPAVGVAVGYDDGDFEVLHDVR